jgi:hypothetical protein
VASIDWVTWWCWRRWNIYCPTYKITDSSLDKQHNFVYGLFCYDEAFVSPCTLNEINVGGFRGKWTPTIKLIGMTDPDGDKNDYEEDD